MKDNSNSDMNGMVKPLIFGVLISLAVSALFMFIFAAILSKTGAADSAIVIMSMMSLGIGAVAGGFTASKLLGESGLIAGALSGAIQFLIITLISLIISSSGLTIQSVIKLVLMVVCSAVGGVLGVNIKRKNKII